MSANPRPTYGGQAVLEGVMIRGQKYACVAVRRPDGSIALKADSINTFFTGKLRRFPFLRGVMVLAETLVLGMSALTWSANASMDEEEEEIGRVGMAMTIAMSLLFAVLLFFILPLFASRPFEGLADSDVISNIVEGLIRLGVFLAYIYLIGRMKQIRRVFMYHGAEHMTVHAHENHDPLEISAVRRYPAAHPRCGTAFLLTVMFVAIAVFAAIPRDPLWWLITSRVVLLPLIAAISYEAIRFSGFHSDNRIVRLLATPSLALQALTTREPDDDQIEVAIAAMKHTLDADEGRVVVET